MANATVMDTINKALSRYYPDTVLENQGISDELAAAGYNVSLDLLNALTYYHESGCARNENKTVFVLFFVGLLTIRFILVSSFCDHQGCNPLKDQPRLTSAHRCSCVTGTASVSTMGATWITAIHRRLHAP